jgi:CBS domain-containing protein
MTCLPISSPSDACRLGGPVMSTTCEPVLALTASDLMKGPVAVLREGVTLREAARLLCKDQVSGAPVVDAKGRCVGVLSASDFLHWAEEGGEAASVEASLRACDYQKPGLEAGGRAGILCTLPEGACPAQVRRANARGEQALFCQMPHAVFVDWQEAREGLLGGEVSRYMTADPVTAPPETPLADLARMMVDADVHRVIIVDEEARPVGVVTSHDIVAAVARPGVGPR